ncbi:SCO family protein, partial [Escherichia coli]|nr:SCO family protein [Escherichia coli]
TVSERDFAGKPYLMFFGFTHCPDVCPTTLQQISDVLAALGPKADTLKVAFVSVDPERDTPESLKTYLSSFDPRIVGLTGSPEQV